MERANLKDNKSLKPGLYNGFQKVMAPIFGVLSTMLLAHKALSKPEMGVWSLFLVVTSVVELFRHGLVKTSLIKYINYSKDDEHSAVMSAAFFLNVIVTATLCVLLFFFSHQIALLVNAPRLEPMLYIFIAGMLFLIPFSHFEWIMYGKSLFKNLFWTYLVRQGFTLLVIFLYYIIQWFYKSSHAGNHLFRGNTLWCLFRFYFCKTSFNPPIHPIRHLDKKTVAFW